jgi:class 3 adenylate cyclase/tetratricopeptide (TPR) repeat protein
MAITCPWCSSENDRFARRCAACQKPLPRMCPACDTINGDDASFCSNCGGAIDDIVLRAARERAEYAAGLLPKDFSAKFLDSTADHMGDRRQLTVLFVDLVRSTEILQAIGSEAMADFLDEFLDGVAHAVNQFGGTVAEITGDGAVCLFGAPRVHEDDPERALRSALAIQRLVFNLRRPSVKGLAWQPQVRIGVHTGTVVLRVVGHDYRLAYAPVGEVVHFSARLQTAAHPAEILVSDTTVRLTSSLFRFGVRRMVSLKGFSDQYWALPLLGERDTAERRPMRSSASTFVGREPDLAALRSRLDHLANGLGGILTIWGEAGIGKSRLVAEARRRSPMSIRWLESRGVSYAQHTPYSIIAQQIRRAAGITEETTERSARAKLRTMIVEVCGEEEASNTYPFIATALGMQLDTAEGPQRDEVSGEALQREIFRALGTLVSAASEQSPLVLFFEDLHWSDGASIAAIDNLLPLAETHSILFLLLARSDPNEPSWVLRHKIETIYPHLHMKLELQPLSAAGSSELAMKLLEADRLPIELQELVFNKAEGIPLFVEELTRSLVEQGLLMRDDAGWRLTVPARDMQVPDTVQGIIQARFDRLDMDLKNTLRAAAVLGPVVIYRVLADMTEVGPCLTGQLRDLQRLQFLQEISRRPEMQYAFKHALIREVVYQTLLQRSRSELHLKAGKVMENLFGARLSEYEGIIAEHFLRAEVWDRAADYLLRAGDESIRLHAHAEARLHYAKGMEALGHLPDTTENQRRRVDTIVKQAAVSYIAEAPEVNLERLGKGEQIAQTLLERRPGDAKDGLRLARVHYWMGRVKYISGDPAESIIYHKRALASAKRLDDPRLVAMTSAMIGQAYTTQGQWSKAKALLETALPTLESSGEWREWCLVSGYLGVSIAACGEYDRGLQVLHRGVDRALELRGWNLIASTRVLLCAGYLMNERMLDLVDAAQDAIEASERAGERVVLYVGFGFRSWAESRLGKSEAAFQSMRRSQEIAAGLGRLLLADWFSVARADIALMAGQAADAIVLAEDAVKIAGRANSVFSAGLAHRVWAHALVAMSPPRFEEAERHLSTSIELLESGDARLQAAHTHVIWGRLCRDRGDRDAAIYHFRLAEDQFENSGLRDELQVVRDSMSELIGGGRLRHGATTQP